jgi:hypothetical protein
MRSQEDFIRTFTGRRFWPLDPSPSEVDILDIAHALSLKCRYGGHASRFYSVAEHSCRMSDYASEDNKLPALMHDCAEAFLPDIVRPVKRHPKMAPFFGPIEEQVERAIVARYPVEYPWPEEVHQLDFSILTDEMYGLLPGQCRSFLRKPDGSWRYGPPLGIDPWRFGWSPRKAERQFLKRFYRLTEPRRFF